jgi:hypothetical protein
MKTNNSAVQKAYAQLAKLDDVLAAAKRIHRDLKTTTTERIYRRAQSEMQSFLDRLPRRVLLAL